MAADLTGLACPVPIHRYPTVQMAHGGGGRLSQQLVEDIFMPAFANAALGARHDGARLEFGGVRLAFSTDSYVVRPIFFPGGDIGTLAINGTVNDLAMCGARPKFLSAAFVLEEGLDMDIVERVAASMKAVAHAAGVTVVTGDTKVVDRGKGDGLYVTTSGVGIIEHEQVIAPMSVRDGDVVLLSGDLARHGMAVMAVREGLEFESKIESDCASVAAPVMALFEAGIEVHCLRDLTRGGLASAVVEIAQAAGLCIRLDEETIPVREDVRGACEILGFDPIYVANEGRFIAIVPARAADQALRIMQNHAVSSAATPIGTVAASPNGLVTMKSRIGATRIVDMLSGEQLPRIC